MTDDFSGVKQIWKSSNSQHMSGSRSGERIESLDALRGLAAVSVVLHHILIASPPIWFAYGVIEGSKPMKAVQGWVTILAFSPLHILWNGQEAVMIFFVLSGFVLMQPFLTDEAPPYRSFLIRRIFRIYPTCWAALAFSALLMSLVGYPSTPNLSGGFLISRSRPLALSKIWTYVLLIGGGASLDTVIWSLWHEVRVSLVFPKIAKWILGNPSSIVVLVSSMVYIIMATVRHIGGRAITPTINFACLFVWGALVAKHRREIMARFGRLSRPTKTLAAILALTLYNARWEWASLGWKSPDSELVDAFVDLGSALILVIIVGCRRADLWLRRRFFLWLGKISYSLYLIHIPILSAFVYGLNRALPYWAIAILVVPCSLSAAASLNRFVELPSIDWGKFLSQTMRKNAVGVLETVPIVNITATNALPHATSKSSSDSRISRCR